MKRPGEILRSKVLKLMQQHDGPLSAYDILDKLTENKEKVAPVQVYRALDGLKKTGQVHRLESLNAFIPCQCDDHGDPAVLSICDDCGGVEENVAPDVVSELSLILKKQGFSAQRHVIEVHGICASCDGEATIQ